MLSLSLLAAVIAPTIVTLSTGAAEQPSDNWIKLETIEAELARFDYEQGNAQLNRQEQQQDALTMLLLPLPALEPEPEAEEEIEIALDAETELIDPDEASVKRCAFQQVGFHVDFPTARLYRCEESGENRYTLHTTPESLPINPSPWYAFTVENRTEEPLAIEVVIISEDMPVRYRARLSSDKIKWSKASYANEEADGDGERFFAIEMEPKESVYVAGQEIIDSEMQSEWLNELSQSSHHKVFNIGRSTQDRPLEALRHHAPESNDWLILIGRQHPPEVTGVMALQHFSELLFSGSEEADALLERLNVLLIPNMNPDGVYHGNWRHTYTGVDMNRDWADRTQPETQALHKYLQELTAEGQNIRFAIDFHSTHRNVFYTMPTDYVTVDGQELSQPNFVDEWLAELQESVAPLKFEVKPGARQNSGIFKQYIADVYGVHAVTYEVGDNTERDEIERTAKAAMRSLYRTLLRSERSEQSEQQRAEANEGEQENVAESLVEIETDEVEVDVDEEEEEEEGQP